jgi:hypothetical protein
MPWYGRLWRWLVAVVVLGLLLLLLDPFVQWVDINESPRPGLFGYFRAWLLGGDLFVISGTIAIAALCEAYFNKRKSGLAEFFKNAAALVCVVAFVTSIAFTLMTAAHYRDASGYIYAKAYVQASELRDSVSEEATPKEAAGQEVAKASWDKVSREYGYNRAVMVSRIAMATLGSSVLFGGLIVALGPARCLTGSFRHGFMFLGF